MTTPTQSAGKEAQHTPVPWKVSTNPGGPGDQPAFPSIRDSSGLPHGQDIVAMPLGDSETVNANAAFIVKAVNSHDKLVGALEKLLRHPIGISTNSMDVAEARAALSAAHSVNNG